MDIFTEIAANYLRRDWGLDQRPPSHRRESPLGHETPPVAPVLSRLAIGLTILGISLIALTLAGA